MMDMGENHGYGGLTHLRQYGARNMGGHCMMVSLVGDDHDREMALHSAAAPSPAAIPSALGPPPPFPPPSVKRNPTERPQQLRRRADPFSGGAFEVDGGNPQGRWPRQETLTLLEVRSRLDPRFKEAAHKAPLWDEVARIMWEEHGYRRSGKKCREKLENLYKYYKKTKEGRGARQDGKHYRFFRQLEALYGDNNNNNNNAHMGTNGTGSSQENVPVGHRTCTASTPSHVHLPFQEANIVPNRQHDPQQRTTSCCNIAYDDNYDRMTTNYHRPEYICHRSSDDDEDASGGRWRWRIKEMVDHQVRRFMDVQERWLERMLRTMEGKERERIHREEEWRKREADRLEREHRYWATERAWIEARDEALMQALEKAVGGSVHVNNDITVTDGRGPETVTSEAPEELATFCCEDDSDDRSGGRRSQRPAAIKNSTVDVGNVREGGGSWSNPRVDDHGAKTPGCPFYQKQQAFSGGRLVGGDGDACGFRFLIEGESVWDRHHHAVDADITTARET